MYFGIFFLGLLWEALRRLRWRVGAPPALDGTLGWSPAVAAVLLAAALIAQLAVIAYMAANQIVSPCWRNFPIPVVADLTENTGGPAQILPSFLLVAIAAIQSALLALLLGALRAGTSSTWQKSIVALCFAAALAAALVAPAMTSPDPLLYMMFAKLGFAAFAAQPHAVTIADLPLSQWCTQRVLPSAYGPGFILYIEALVGGLHSPIASIMLMRVANTAWLAALLLLLRAAGVPPALLAVTALNPALLFQYIANPHNDIIVCTFVVAAIVIAKRSALLGSLLVVMAGLFKLPFVLIGCLIFVRLPSRAMRLAASALTIATTIGVSYLLAGPKYFEGLSYYSHLLAPDADGLQWLGALIALGAVGAALFWRRFSFAAIYAFPALPIVELAPWYAIWSLPYALVERTSLDRFLVLLPLMLVLIEPGIARSAQLTLYGVVAAVIGAGMLQDVARRRRCENRPPIPR